MYILPWDITKQVIGSLVSVVTPTYNRPEHIIKCVESVKKQSYENIEHIIVGDGCPVIDGLRNELLKINPNLVIINLLQDESIKYIPARIANLRNKGISVAKGDFIAHLDDDNLWEINHIENLISKFIENPRYGVAISSRRLLIDGIIPYRLSIHPWASTKKEGEFIWSQYQQMGVYCLNSDIMKDRISFHELRAITADTNEMLIRHQVHTIVPFIVEIPQIWIDAELGEDDIFSEQIYRLGIPIAYTGEATLLFRIGGRFTSLGDK